VPIHFKDTFIVNYFWSTTQKTPHQKRKQPVYDTRANTPKSEIDQRIAHLKSQLAENQIDAALFLQRADLFYFSGTIQEAHLYVPLDEAPVLMVYKNFDRAIAESPLSRIVPLTSPKAIPEILNQFDFPSPQTIGMELDVLPVNLYRNYQRMFEDRQLVDVSHLIRLVRALKSPYEIDIMRQAATLSDAVAEQIPALLREGMTELELAGQVEAEARKRGHQGVVRMRLWGSEMFYGHLMAGPAGAIPSFLSSPTGGIGASPAVAQGPGFRPIQQHEPVLVDYVFALNGYNSDHARIFAIGELPDDLMAAHAAMLELQALIKQEAKPGVPCGTIYDLALDWTRTRGYDDYFMGVGPERIRFVGHGVGIELDEYPFLAAGQRLELQAGMTLALEPKLIFPQKGVVGVENTHLVTANGLEQFGRFPDDIVIV
jgi:Xaa-Pro aminopeptidase